MFSVFTNTLKLVRAQIATERRSAESLLDGGKGCEPALALCRLISVRRGIFSLLDGRAKRFDRRRSSVLAVSQLVVSFVSLPGCTVYSRGTIDADYLYYLRIVWIKHYPVVGVMRSVFVNSHLQSLPVHSATGPGNVSQPPSGSAFRYSVVIKNMTTIARPIVTRFMVLAPMCCTCIEYRVIRIRPHPFQCSTLDAS